MSRIRPLRALPGSIWSLGLVSLSMDVSSELVHSLLPVFLSSVLGASMLTIGLIEGVAEATAAGTKVLSGAWSDRLRRRKWLAAAGYGLAALTKPVFALAPTVSWVFAARFVDRVGKGIRGAPRDALVADLTPPSLRGAAYGLRQALDSLGAFLGPLLALLLMAWLHDDVRAVLWMAVPPAFLAPLLIALAVREPERRGAGGASALALRAVRRLGLRFWLVVALGAVFTLARFSEAFLVLRAADVGLPMGRIPLVMMAMNLVYAGSAYPAGAAADRLGARPLLLLGIAVLIAADVALALAPGVGTVFLGAGLWGLHMAFTQGLLAKLVSEAAPEELRGTGFGIFHLVSGASLLLASTMAGALWEALGPRATFTAGGLLAALAALGLLLHRAPRRATRP